LTDWRKVWHADGHWTSALYWHLKFRTFTNSRWQTAAILKNERTAIFTGTLQQQRFTLVAG